MACNASLAVNVSYVSGRCKNIGNESRHIYSPILTALLAYLPCQPTCLVNNSACTLLLEVDLLSTNIALVVYFS